MPKRTKSSIEQRNTNGFTLVEVLVAFTILATSIGVIYQILATGRQQIDEASKATTGLNIAQSVIAEYAQSQVPNEGYIDDYHWTVSLSDFKPVKPADASQSIENQSKPAIKAMEEQARQRNPIKLTEIEVTVSWKSTRGRQQVTLSTLRPLKGVNL